MASLGNLSRLETLPVHAVTRVLKQASTYAFALQRQDFHWCAELRSNPTVTAEYVFMRQALGLPLAPQAAALSQWFLGEQNPDGSFGVAFNEPGDVSTTTEVYFALKLLGEDIQSPAMKAARAYVIGQGGVAKVRVFTRIFLAMFGLFPWAAVPQLPAEFILLPKWIPINIYKLACWARGTMVPLLLILHHKPVYALPNGQSANNTFLDELWCDAGDKNIPYMPPLRELWREHGVSWSFFFASVDTVVKNLGGLRNFPLRALARERCVQWILERQETTGDWAGIFPPMVNNLFALPLEGYALDSEPMRLGLGAMERFAWEDGNGRRMQACVSPVWDTLLTMIGLSDAGLPGSHPRMKGAAKWLCDRQLTGPEGDWRVYRPKLKPGGWSFEYHNTWYPDVDDTAAIVLALVKQDAQNAASVVVHRAVEWMLGMQNRDGGWGAFDVDNDKLFLNDIPFADMGALCDPSTPDVTGRLLEAFGLLMQVRRVVPGALPGALYDKVHASCARAIQYIVATQEACGGWWGRWGVNYVYGTANVLCGLSRMDSGVPADCIARAVAWICSAQHNDGGWGEHLGTYHDSTLAGQGDSTASQTAWALMALLAHVPVDDASIERGVEFLVRSQGDDGTWPEPQTTATGFPRQFYVRYDMYRHYFPMMALGRYAQEAGLPGLQDVH